jgi:hypothetical protein
MVALPHPHTVHIVFSKWIHIAALCAMFNDWISGKKFGNDDGF